MRRTCFNTGSFFYLEKNFLVAGGRTLVLLNYLLKQIKREMYMYEKEICNNTSEV